MILEEIDKSLSGNAYAGSFSYLRDLIGYGSCEGKLVLISYPELREVAHVKLFKSSLLGIQIGDEYVACLGNDLESCNNFPVNFETRLKVLSKEKLTSLQEVNISPGNWNMVKGLSSGFCILYDSSEEQGVVIYDIFTGNKIWEVEGFSLKIAYVDGAFLIGIIYNDKLLVVKLFDDYEVSYLTLPEPEKYCWTYAIRNGDDCFTLGGYQKVSGQIFISNWYYKTGEIVTIYSGNLENFYEKDFLDSFCEEEWLDLNHVSFMTIFKDKKTLIFTLGGDGVGNVLADTSSSMVIKYDLLDKKILDLKQIDESEGCSGVVGGDKGIFLFDCYSSLKLLTI